MSNIPEDIKFTSTHTWVELYDDGLVRVGITDYAQQELGDIVYVELPEVERSYNSGDECAVVESVKSASDIHCPVSGEIIEINSDLEESPELINSDPYADGWLFVIRPDDETELDELLDADAYQEFIENEEQENN